MATVAQGRDSIRLFVLHSLTAGVVQARGNVERANVERGTWNVQTCERGNVERGTWNVRTCERGTCERGSGRARVGHWCADRTCIRLFVLHSLTAGVVQARGNVERANVERGTWNVQTCERGNVERGTWNVRTCERGTCERGSGRARVGHWCADRTCIRLFVLHSLTAGVVQARGNVRTWNVERANVRTCERGSGCARVGHWCADRASIRLFVLHSLTAGMVQARANVGMCERGTWNVGTWERELKAIT